VAIVNGEEITAAELNAELGEAAASAANQKDLRNAALQRLIDRKLVVQQAKNEDIDKSPEFLNRQRRANDELLVNMLVSRQANASNLPSPQEIQKFQASRPEMFANREVWTLEQLVYNVSKDPAVQARITAAKSLQEIAQVLSGSGTQFTRLTKKLDTAIFPHDIYAQIAKVKPGEPFIAPGGDRAVASVIVAREATPTTGDEARQLAIAGIRKERVGNLIRDRVKSLRGSAKIEYQPGFQPAAKS
jgi:EpsD family peptidyl-prolyl cis-trans isomerase